MKQPSSIQLRLETLESRHLLSGGPLEASEESTLEVVVRDSYLPDIPMLVRINLLDSESHVDRSLWNGSAVLTSSNPNVQLNQNEVRLVNGVGSALVSASGTEDFDLRVTMDALATSKSIRTLHKEPRTTGTLSGPETIWSGVVEVKNDLLIQEGQTLRIEPGTLVLIEGVPVTEEPSIGTQIEVEGSLIAAGTQEMPISFTAANSTEPWSEIDVDGGTVELNFVNITNAGNSPRGGHTKTGPAVRLRDEGSIRINSSNVTDIRGKVMQATSGDLTLNDTLFSRAVMGPEIDNTSLEMQDSWIIDMAGRFHFAGEVDDNDLIYIHSQSEGQNVVIENSVFAIAQDDGIDTLGAKVTIRDSIIRDIDDKAASIFSDDATLERVLISNADFGINVKGSDDDEFDLSVLNSTIVNVQTGIRAQDKGSPDPDVKMHVNVENSIVVTHQGGTAFTTDYDPNDIKVNYSIIPTDWSHEGSGEGNIFSDPAFADAAEFDFRLTKDSPAVDNGNPDSNLDPDGTRNDIGAFYFEQPSNEIGDFNGDGVVDSTDIDLLCAAIHSEFRVDFDLNGDNVVDVNDFERLIEDIIGTTLGDSNLDGIFNSKDLIKIFQAGQYEDGIEGNSNWETGDWNCDGEFSSGDLVSAFQKGGYTSDARPLLASAAAVLQDQQANNLKISIYNRFLT